MDRQHNCSDVLVNAWPVKFQASIPNELSTHFVVGPLDEGPTQGLRIPQTDIVIGESLRDASTSGFALHSVNCLATDCPVETTEAIRSSFC